MAAARALHLIQTGSAVRIAGRSGALAAELARALADVPCAQPTLVYLPHWAGGGSAAPDLNQARQFFASDALRDAASVVLISSAAVFTPCHHNLGLTCENIRSVRGGANPIARAWLDLEELAAKSCGLDQRLTVLRAAPVLTEDGEDPLASLLYGGIACPLPGYDPPLQFLSASDLCRAVCGAVQSDAAGTFHIAPRRTIALRAAIGLAGGRALPLPFTLQRLLRRRHADQLAYRRYVWTISSGRSRQELGFEPAHSSAQAIAGLAAARRLPAGLPRDIDDFGMDKGYIAAFGRTLFRFLHDFYWRIEESGIENVPAAGRAVLVGLHRGFMPFDGVMILHTVVRHLGRYPRFLVHPGLLKFPFLSNFMRKLGGIVASQPNADYVLGRDEILAVFPEGVRGAFRMYRDAYRLGSFGRDDFVRIALRHGAPIVPFVTVGSAEIFPILGRIDWSWWKQYSEWPFLPITPTFPLLPVPLPSKWHTRFLEPIHIEREYPPEAANDAETVRAITAEVRRRMDQAIQDMRRRRRHIFFGSLRRPAREES